MTKRRKAPAKTLPQTLKEALEKGERYLELSRQLEQMDADADTAITTIQTARDKLKLPVEQEVKQIFCDLRDWWAVASPELLDNGKKSREFGALIIGERRTPPALKHPGAKAGDLADDLTDLELEEFLRRAVNLEKAAILKALKEDEQLATLLIWLGFKAEQKEEFFIDRAAPAEADPEILQLEDDAI